MICLPSRRTATAAGGATETAVGTTFFFTIFFVTAATSPEAGGKVPGEPLRQAAEVPSAIASSAFFIFQSFISVGRLGSSGSVTVRMQ